MQNVELTHHAESKSLPAVDLSQLPEPAIIAEPDFESNSG